MKYIILLVTLLSLSMTVQAAPDSENVYVLDLPKRSTVFIECMSSMQLRDGASFDNMDNVVEQCGKWAVRFSLVRILPKKSGLDKYTGKIDVNDTTGLQIYMGLEQYQELKKAGVVE